MERSEWPAEIPDTEEQKRVAIENLVEGEPDALFLLSGISEVVDTKTQEKKYKPGSYADVDWNGYMTGGKGRALAVAELAKYFPEATVAANSNTFNVHDSQAPTDADVMAEYLEKKGVETERIIKQDQSTTTFTELIELIKYISEHQWKHVAVVAGETQKPRAMEMFRQISTLQDPAGAWKDPVFRKALEVFKQLQPKITFVAAESVLPIRDKRYANIIAQARETETWKTREALDKKAVDDLVGGRYWKNS